MSPTFTNLSRGRRVLVSGRTFVLADRLGMQSEGDGRGVQLWRTADGSLLQVRWSASMGEPESPEVLNGMGMRGCIRPFGEIERRCAAENG